MHTVHLAGQSVFKHAVRKLVELSECLLRRNGYTARDVALFVPNQSNIRIVTAAAQRLGLESGMFLISMNTGTLPARQSRWRFIRPISREGSKRAI